jgi:hypothetical protein
MSPVLYVLLGFGLCGLNVLFFGFLVAWAHKMTLPF